MRCQPSHGPTVCAHHVDVTIAATVAPEGNPPAVRRPERILIPAASRGQPPEQPPIGAHRIELEVAAAIARENESAPIRRPARVEVDSLVVRQPPGARPVPACEVNLAIPVRRADIDDPPAVRRSHRLVRQTTTGHHLPQAAASWPDLPHLVLGQHPGKHDAPVCPRARPGGLLLARAGPDLDDRRREQRRRPPERPQPSDAVPAHRCASSTRTRFGCPPVHPRLLPLRHVSLRAEASGSPLIAH